MSAPQTVDDLIREFLGIQPADCKHVNLLRLAAALKVSGSVIRHGMVVSVKDVGDEVQVDFERREATKVPATETMPERDPTDEELSVEWKLPVAATVALTPETKASDTPPSAEHPIPAPSPSPDKSA